MLICFALVNLLRSTGILACNPFQKLDFLIGNHENMQRSTEDEVYRRIQQAKVNRGRGGYAGRGRGGVPFGSRSGSTSEFRPPPPPKQNSKGRNSKHQFWPHPDYNNNRNSNSNNRNNHNNNNGSYGVRGRSSTLSYGEKGESRSVIFRKAETTAVPDLVDRSTENVECEEECEEECEHVECKDVEQDASDGEDNSGNESSGDDMIHRSIDCGNAHMCRFHRLIERGTRHIACPPFSHATFTFQSC